MRQSNFFSRVAGLSASVSTVVDDWGLPFMSVVFYYLLRVVVDSLGMRKTIPMQIVIGAYE